MTIFRPGKGCREGKEGTSLLLKRKTQKRVLEFFFFFCSYLEELELIFPVQFYSWCLILAMKQYTTPRAVNIMRPAPAGRFMARYSTARASDASDRLDFSRGDGCCSAFIGKKRGTAERLRATEECLLLSTRSQMVPHNTTHPPPSPPLLARQCQMFGFVIVTIGQTLLEFCLLFVL